MVAPRETPGVLVVVGLYAAIGALLWKYWEPTNLYVHCTKPPGDLAVWVQRFPNDRALVKRQIADWEEMLGFKCEALIQGPQALRSLDLQRANKPR